MTPLNTIIEEEGKEIHSRFDGSDVFWKIIIKHLTPETIAFIKGDYTNTCTTAMQRAYEAGKASNAQENTPDTEGDAYSRGYKQGKFDAEMDRLNEKPPTPDTEWEGIVRTYLEKQDGYVGETYDLSTVCLDGWFDLEELAQSLLTSHDTYWKERVTEKDDLLDDMWGLICNVNGGIVEKEKEEWYQAFLRIRTKYFTNKDNLK